MANPSDSNSRERAQALNETPVGYIPLDPRVSELVSAASGEVGLDLLLLFGRDPMTCDTADGFAMRLHQPVDEVRDALSCLSNHGLVRISEGPSNTSQVSYWLREESSLFSSLSHLVEFYLAGPLERRRLLRSISGRSATAA